jgi:selenocysteine lyase/cysteine desulfurase
MPIKALAALAHAHGAIIVVDGAQGTLPEGALRLEFLVPLSRKT